ncbi:T9SS type A sorting domain-containing protein [Hyunsoonleella pacifica]|uniref:T9SS type A sorting domain-containing protein n=1 Tax=Hyunsoonleella pacifica TaxID=1080224 RepID=A0A4Q9FV06_9FLAO|nr:T9SS type A sorting domain-containing protein [Hyunsoonleella pacifica]TBN17879.1 T9SS type A sorting domain-containing protein [Hyunsoonleella pacifica]GGD08119.1 T9SS C-terminal target domain-containing protein [Hyunsoonleella pacifica]
MTLAVNILRRLITVNYTFIISKVILFAIVILGLNNCLAQDLYVDNDSYLYARDVVLFVNDDIRLETTTSNIYMRGNAQLMQNTDIKNSDAGELSIYQNQTTGIYEYNFWCSPVGVSIDGTTNANVDFDGTSIHDPADHTDLTNVTSSAYAYTNSYNGNATQLSQRWIYTLISAGGYNGWVYQSSTGNIASGYGFTLKGSPNVNNVLDLRGRPNNGDISIDCTFTGVDLDPLSGSTTQVETLTGNPYPSALDLKLFLTDGFDGTTSLTGTNNRNILSGEIFFWEQVPVGSHNLQDYQGGYSVYNVGDPLDLSDNGSYATAPFENYNLDGSVNGATAGNTQDFTANNARRYAAIGQGFIVSSLDNGGAASGGTAVFNNAMRLYLAEDSTTGGNGSVFAKTQSKNKTEEHIKPQVIAMSHNGIDYQQIINNPITIPEIRIHTKVDNTFYRESVIAFRDGTPNNNTYNRFFDGRNYEGGLTRDAYLLSEGKELVIKSINYSEDTKIPMGLKANKDNTSFEITVHNLRAIPETVSIYVHDKLNDTYTDIRNATFSVVLEEGIYNERFEISFSNESTLNIEAIDISDFKVFENFKRHHLEIINPKRKEINTVKLYDVSGKLVLQQNITSTKRKNIISTRSLSSGIYLVSLKLSDNQTLNKKVVISGN